MKEEEEEKKKKKRAATKRKGRLYMLVVRGLEVGFRVLERETRETRERRESTLGPVPEGAGSSGVWWLANLDFAFGGCCAC